MLMSKLENSNNIIAALPVNLGGEKNARWEEWLFWTRETRNIHILTKYEADIFLKFIAALESHYWGKTTSRTFKQR